MNEENPSVDSENELVDELGTTENETQGEEFEELEEESSNAELEESDSDEEEATDSVKVEKQGNVPKGAQKRIDKLTKQKHELSERLAKQAEEHQKELHHLEEQRLQSQKFLDAPAPENLDEMAEEERIAYYTQKGIAKSNQEQLQSQQQQVIARHKAQAWNEKVQAKSEDLPDFKEVMSSTAKTFNLSQQTTNDLMEFIGESDVGVELAYHLGKNPHIANSLQGLSPRAMDRKLMRLEDKLEAQPTTTQPITKAKAPISKSKGSVKTNKVASNTRDFWRNVGAKG